MKQTLTTFIIIILSCSCVFAESNVIWQQVDPQNIISKGKQLLVPSQYLVYSLSEEHLKQQLYTLPYEPGKNQILLLPLPDGSLRTFVAWQTHIMEPLLEAKYSFIKTFTAYAEDDPRVIAKIDVTPRGFHAMIFDGVNTSFIDPYSDVDDGYYICYYKRDYTRANGQYMSCGVNDDVRLNQPYYTTSSAMANMRLVNGNLLRKFRMALACTGEYAQAVGGATPTKTTVLSAMITSMNRVNGVYERELAITMQLVNKEDTLIFLTTGAYDNGNIFALLTQNQDTVDRRIGSANYDLGHVFSTGGGGYSQIGCACYPTQKAQSETGALSPTGDAYDIDFVAHEIGHEFGADHSFNDNSNGGCSGNAEYTQAFEPGSGSTIMCYAGLCNNDNMQMHSDDYFHGISLQVIDEFITRPFIVACAASSNSGNKPVQISAFSASYTIPYLTPFELTAPAIVDSVADTLNTYCWEEWDRGDFGQTFANTHNAGPIFRSFTPDASRTRVFPKLAAILKDTLNYLGEKVPDVARTLNFKLTVRDIYNGVGCVHMPDDSIRLQVINTGSAFAVTSNEEPANWFCNSVQHISWNIGGTDKAPINCDSVAIYLSADGGYTYPYFLTKAPNNGAAYINVPEMITNNGRIKIKGAGNVFFSINKSDITINYGESVILYPVPARDVLNVRILNHDQQQVTIFNAIGQSVYQGACTSQCNINTAAFSKGVYYIKIKDTRTNINDTKPFVVR